MAKRRRLEAPSAERLAEIAQGFARETSPSGPLGPLPPIAAQASDAASAHNAQSGEARAEAARTQTDADHWRRALREGLVVQTVPTDGIITDELMRDRLHIDPEQMDELKNSIEAHGLRLPIELFELAEKKPGETYGLLSGWRRLHATRALFAETGEAKYGSINAFIRRVGTPANAYVAMVEENEIRADLSQYERGRIAVLAAEHGAFASLEAAVDQLFQAGSKAKRSKIRSFAELHRELGDVLAFPAALSERQGLRIVAAIRAGAGDALRHALTPGQGDASAEWAVIEPVLTASEASLHPPARPKGGRPSTPKRSGQDEGYFKLSNGITLQHDTDSRGHFIRLQGQLVNADMVASVLFEIRRLLEPK
jgi:ParB family chromosome partitioning protein